MINEKSAETRQPPPTVDEMRRQVLDRADPGDGKTYGHYWDDVGALERAGAAAVTSRTNEMSAAFYAKTPASADLATAATDCEQTARQLLHLPGPSDE